MEQEQLKPVWRAVSAAIGLSLFVALCVVAVWESYAGTRGPAAGLCFQLAGFLFWLFWFPPRRKNSTRTAWTVLMVVLVIGGVSVLVWGQ